MARIWLAAHGPRPVGNELAEATDLSDSTVTRALGHWRKGWTRFFFFSQTPPSRTPTSSTSSSREVLQRARDFYGQ